jgi:hypothetical protein
LSIVCFDCSCTIGDLFQINTHNVACSALTSVGNLIGQTAVEMEGEVYIDVLPFVSTN